jgi:addiction module HigA family antidote
MTMHLPPHPAEGLKDDLDALSLSTAQAAEALGVTRQQLHRVLTRQSGISPEMALRLEAVIGARADHWLRLQAAYDLAQARQAKPDLVKGLRRLSPAAQV